MSVLLLSVLTALLLFLNEINSNRSFKRAFKLLFMRSLLFNILVEIHILLSASFRVALHYYTKLP